MARWEICKIRHGSQLLTEAAFLRQAKYLWWWQADLFGAANDAIVVARTSGWEVNDVGQGTREDQSGASGTQLRSLIAELGSLGWEPMPLGSADVEDVYWYFKRQLPDA
jgi:hypothetical protein